MFKSNERKELIDKCFKMTMLYSNMLKENRDQKYRIKGLEEELNSFKLLNNNYQAYKSNYDKLYEEYNKFIKKENESIEKTNKLIEAARLRRIIGVLEDLFNNKKYVELIETHSSIKSKTEEELPLVKKVYNDFTKDLENTTTCYNIGSGQFHSTLNIDNNSLCFSSFYPNYTSKETAEYIIETYKKKLKTIND
jgi:hypothetical protein